MKKKRKKLCWSYRKPTPIKIRMWADGILAASIFITSSSILDNHKIIAIIVLLAGGISKLISSLFAEKKNVQ